MPSPELAKAIENIETFKKVVRAKVPARADKLLGLVDVLEENIMTAPSSTRTEYHGAFPGGLVDTSLNVLKTMGSLNKVYEAGIDAESLVVTGLFYDIGKSGTEKGPYYIPKRSDWHNQQGIMYEINPKLVPMTPANRSLFLLQGFGVWLTEEEHYAIASIKDRIRPGEESLPTTNEPMLAVLLQQAVRAVSLKGANRVSLLEK